MVRPDFFLLGEPMPVDPNLYQLLLQLSQAPEPAGLEELRAGVIANAARSPKRPVTIGEVRDLSVA
ncbi:MAG TPA: lipase, partial [Deinococcus radiodurans]|nr:lipase [Deinococcus radiodurans]